MTTRNPPVPTYIDLARAEAYIKRKIEPARFVRLLPLVEELEAVYAELAFCFDDRKRLQVTGRAVADVKLNCQLCTNPVTRELHAEVAGVLARSEQEADVWRAEGDTQSVIVISAPELNEIELLEDELLLSLPSQVCTDTSCKDRPVLAYGPAATDAAADTGRKPFAELDKLLEAADKRSDT